MDIIKLQNNDEKTKSKGNFFQLTNTNSRNIIHIHIRNNPREEVNDIINFQQKDTSSLISNIKCSSVNKN